MDRWRQWGRVDQSLVRAELPFRHCGSEVWINGLRKIEPREELLLDYCFSHMLSLVTAEPHLSWDYQRYEDTVTMIPSAPAIFWSPTTKRTRLSLRTIARQLGSGLGAGSRTLPNRSKNSWGRNGHRIEHPDRSRWLRSSWKALSFASDRNCELTC